ncbi:PilT/PilU family type 4a pilus ATPase [Leifsonia sp. YAF41]|uniref:type IV pilus twitching motility protein PilT n=1 Tax=Leifsonia sp. YAF41 TaxID=3233086 RepID=UPI003F958927
MDKPIYEIPVTPPEGTQGEWAPKRLIPPTFSPPSGQQPAPTYEPAPTYAPVPTYIPVAATSLPQPTNSSEPDDGQSSFEALLAELNDRAESAGIAAISPDASSASVPAESPSAQPSPFELLLSGADAVVETPAVVATVVEPAIEPVADPVAIASVAVEPAGLSPFADLGFDAIPVDEIPPAPTQVEIPLPATQLIPTQDAVATTPIYALDDAATETIYSLDDIAPPSGLPVPIAPPTGLPVSIAPPPLTVPAEVSPHVARAEARLTDAERAVLGNANPDLIRALESVVRDGASDLHVTAGAPPSLRVDGGLRPIDGEPRWMPEKVTEALYSLLTDEQRERFEKELELDFAYTAGGARFRVNYYLQRNSIGGAFRLIPQEIKQLAELGVPESIAKFAQLPRGLVLVTGPTGSGKSTTLAALIDLANRTRADHIVTVEDPIEFLHRHQQSLVNQREVGHDTHSFAAALKHVLRQDPDIILIGELRDLETISVALTAAETGHLVFATLHTQDAAQTIDRVIDVFPPHQQGQVRAQLAATLQGVVCQTLVKRASGRGRVVATEVLVTTPAIGNLIREGKTYQITSMMQAGRELGMHTMDQHLADLVNSGQITRQAAVEKAHEPESLSQLIQRVESPTEASARAIAASGIDFGDSYSGVGR